MGALVILCGVGLVVLYSATNGDMEKIVNQLIRLVIGFAVLFFLA